jgi:hypothetical protein
MRVVSKVVDLLWTNILTSGGLGVARSRAKTHQNRALCRCDQTAKCRFLGAKSSTILEK